MAPGRHPPCIARLAGGLLCLLVFISLLTARPSAASPEPSPEPVTLQLRWKHQFQFAGYYAAKEKGFYAREGLDVRFRERLPSKDHVKSVLDGEAEYGTDDATLLVKRLEGQPVVLLAQIFQHSPLVLLARQESGIISPFEMVDKKVMYALRDAPVNSMFLETLGNLSRIRQVDHTFDLDDFLRGKVDVISAYITDAPYDLRQRGVAFNIINPQSYGIDFYGDNLFTTDHEVREHPDRVARMRRASLKGWDYALHHKDEMIDLIVARYRPDADRGRLEFEARMTEMMILPDLIELGSFNARRFDRISETYTRLGISRQSRIPESFFFRGKPNKGFHLTDREKAWLADHPDIEIGIMDAWPPLNFTDNQGSPRGIGADYINALNQRLGNILKIVPGHFESNYQAVKGKRRAALMDITRREERAPFFLFTTPYITIPHVIVGRRDGPYFSCEKDLDGRTVALERGFYSVTYLKKHYPGIRIREYDSTSAALGAVLRKEADAYVGNRTVAIYLMEQELITGLQLQGRSEKPPVALSIGVRKDWPELAAILNRTLASISPEEESRIRKNWMVPDTKQGSAALTPAQRDWVKAHPVISAHNTKGDAPFNFNEDGTPKGFSIDYMNLVSQKAGLSVRYRTGTWPQLLEMVQNSTLDVMLNIARTPEREASFKFSSPYYNQLLALFVRDDVSKIRSVRDLYGKRVAVPTGSYVEALVKRHPDIGILPVKSTKEAVIAVSTGSAEALYNIVTVVNYHTKKLMITNIRPDGEIGLSDGGPMPLCMAVNKANPMLASILDAGLAAVTEAEVARLREKWLGEGRGKATARVQLSEAELKYLAARPVIRVSNERDYPPFDFMVGGKPAGFSIDLLSLLAEKIGIRLQYINGFPWNQLVEKFKRREIDLLHSLVKTDEREKFGIFSNDYQRSKNYYATRVGNPDITEIAQLSGKTVAVGSGWVQEEFLSAHHPEINLLRCGNLEEMLEAVSVGRAYAVINNLPAMQYFIKKKGMTDLKISGWAREADRGEVTTYRFMGQKEAPELISILNKALALTTPQERSGLEEKWFGTGRVKRPELNLTQKEQTYLKQKGSLKMSVLPDWLPYEGIDKEGRHQGIGQEMIRLIAERIGTPIELVPTREWGQSLQNLRDRRCDILPIAMDVPSRKAAMVFTRPYIVEPFVIATRSEELFIKDAGEIGDRKIGIIKDYAFTEVFRSRYPDIRIVDVINAKDGLERVRRREIFGYIDSMPTIAYTLQKYSMLDLKIAGKMDFDLELSIACRKDEPLLASVMQKGADSITEEERRMIIGKWLSIRFEQGFDYALLWKILIGVAGLLLLILFWNRHLSEMNRKIRQANREVQAANQAKSQFLANMSHEIRTPLNAVTGFSELLSSLVTDEKQKSYLEAIKSSGKSLMLLINDILDLSKIEAGKMDIQYGSVDLRALLREIEQIFALQVARKEITFIIHIDETLPPALRLDEIRLRQVLLNIVGNAVKFTDRGRIRLSVEICNAKGETGAVDVLLAVEDTGIGIRAEEKDHIFDAFKQQSHQDSSQYGGTGLGLAISKRLVEMMNGRIAVESVEGKGSRFTILIRDVTAGTREALSKTEAAHLKETRFEGGRVLVVDDVESNRLFLKEALEKAGLDVLEAQNGHEAVIITPEYRPDLILMDIRMPVMNGFEAADLLKNDPRSARIPIVAVTASPSSLKASHAPEKGFSGFISKPVDLNDLMSELIRHFTPEPKDPRPREAEAPEDRGVIPAADIGRIREALESGFTETWTLFKTRQPIREVRAFATGLSELGRKYHADFIEEYGERLLNDANNFDVGKMKETLAAFPGLVTRLRR